MLPIWDGELGKASIRQGKDGPRRKLHITNYLELLATFPALQCFAKHGHNTKNILMRLDSHSSDIHQQTRGNPLTPALSASLNHMGLVHREGNISTGRTPAREGQCNSGLRVEINKGSMRLDAESSGIQSNSTPDGAPRDRLVCFRIDETAIKISCYHPGDKKLSQTTIHCLQSGLADVHKGIGIP